MPKRQKWETLTGPAKIEELHREMMELTGAIQTIRLDLAHILSHVPKADSKKNTARATSRG